jgi:hypothetical protein
LTGPDDPRDCPYVGLDPFEKVYEPFFFGREQDSRVIADHVESRSITVLYGPSGVGKSSVMNVGLPAAFRRRAPWMIVTLRDWQDPNTIERRAIGALQAALPVGITNCHGHARFPRYLVGALRAARQPLLLILDQFEEYFLYRTENLLDAERALGALLARRDLDLHVLIALRDDSLHLLDKLRAIFPGILETTIRLGHLNDAAAKEAIRGPIRQYNKLYRQGRAPIEVEDALVETLIRDLRQGGERPIGEAAGRRPPEPIELPYLQLTMTKLWAAEAGGDATALRAETLTKKLGGVQQIAREHVDGILGQLTVKEQALCADIFRNLVTSSGSKIAYPANDLARQISEDRKQAREGRSNEIVVADDVATVLRKLTPTETRLLKPVKVNGVDAFELFHDVLGKPVLRWRQEFNANARLHAEQRRVRLLLGVAAIFGLITTLAVFATGFAYVQTVGVGEALGRSTWSALELSEYSLDSSDVEGLWRVTELYGDQRDGFLSPLTGTYFERGPALRFAAWAGASLRPMGLHLLDDAQPDLNLGQRFAHRSANVLRALGLRPLNDAQSHAAVENILAEIKQTKDPDQLKDLAEALKALNAKLTEAQAQDVVDTILAVVKQTNGAYPLRTLALALKALPANLTDAQAQIALDPIFAAIKRNSDPTNFEYLAEALQALPAKLAEVPAQAAIGPVLAAIKPEILDPFTLYSLGQALKALPTKLTDQQAQAAMTNFLAHMISDPNDFAAQAQVEALKALGGKLTEAQAQGTLDPILTRIRQTGDPYQLWALAEVLQALPLKLTDAQGQLALDPILTAIKKTSDPKALQTLGQAVQALAPKLTDARAQDALDPVLVAIGHNADPNARQALAKALKELPGKLTGPQAQAAFDSILKAIKQSTDPDDLRSLAIALQGLGPKLTGMQAQTALDTVLVEINRASDPATLASLAKALRALPAKVSDARAAELLPKARMYFASAANEDIEEAWAGTIAALAAYEHTDKSFLSAIVEVLKFPTAAGKPTDTLMDALRQRFPDVPELKGGLDAALPWLEKQLDADVIARPPVRPK